MDVPPNPDPRKSGLEIILVDQHEDLMEAMRVAADGMRALSEWLVTHGFIEQPKKTRG